MPLIAIESLIIISEGKAACKAAENKWDNHKGDNRRCFFGFWFLPFWLIFQNILPFLISGFGVAGGGVAFMAHIGGFVIGFAFGYFYKKTHGSEFTYGTRYGSRGYY